MITTIILVLFIACLLIWLVNKFVPMSPGAKNIFITIIVIIAFAWLLNLFGFFHYVRHLHL